MSPKNKAEKAVTIKLEDYECFDCKNAENMKVVPGPRPKTQTKLTCQECGLEHYVQNARFKKG